jgi:transposase-like protein
MKDRYTIKEFKTDFGTEDQCLEYVFHQRFGQHDHCPHCEKKFSYSKVSSKKKYKCAHCGGEIAPLAGTIFHKSSTPLVLWFHAIFLFSVSKNGVSAKELERQLGVTYKTAWRIAKQVRTLFEDDLEDMLKGTVEVDETYMGGKEKNKHSSKKLKQGRGAVGKTPVIGVVERQGKVKAIVAVDTKESTLIHFIKQSVEKNSQIMTDEYKSYNRVSLHGFKHDRVKHSAKEYVVGDVHTNTIEGFWSQLKRSVNGTYHSVSVKYLQQYVNEFAYRYNYRNRGALFPYLAPLSTKSVLPDYL